MKENFLHFLSDVPSIININGHNIGQIDNTSTMELDIITKTNQIYLTYEPISEQSPAIPYTIKLNTNQEPTCNNEYIKVVPFPNNNYDIIMKPFYYYQVAESNVLYNGIIGKFFISIIVDTMTTITIFSGASITFNAKIVPINSVKVEEEKECIIIKGIIDDNTYYLLIINTKDFSIIHNDISHSIENENNYISSLKKLNTLCNHALVSKVDLTSKSKEEFYVLENDYSITQINNCLVPLAFLQCIQVNDLSNAKVFLSENYQNVSISQFKEYFGEITEIYLNRHNIIPQYLNYSIKSNNWKNYNFLMSNNKIIDIEEIF